MSSALPEVNVDPGVRALISNLVNAVGGAGIDQEGYVLGDEALNCLRDLKQWLQQFDSALNRCDVALSISTTTFVSGDLVQILSQWEARHMAKEPNQKPSAHEDRIALACIELLVPLTWPLELDPLTTTAAQVDAYPHLKRAQQGYKRALLGSNHLVLRAAVRLCVGALKAKQKEPRDIATLRLSLYLFRNLLQIEGQDDIDRGTTILEFETQKVLAFIAPICAGLDKNFQGLEIPVLELLAALLFRVDAEQIIINKQGKSRGNSSKPTAAAAGSSLDSLLGQEEELRRAIFQPTRHSRFGTMTQLRLNADDGSEVRLALSGQQALVNDDLTLQQLDRGKKWRRPAKRVRGDGADRWNVKCFVEPDRARNVLNKFVTKLVESGAFNTIAGRICGMVDRNNQQIEQAHPAQYLYVVAWFLDARRLLNSSVSCVGACLEPRALSLCLRLLSIAELAGFKRELWAADQSYAACLCLRASIQAIEAMARDPSMSDAAEALRARLFYDEQGLELLGTLPREGAQRPVACLHAIIELTHVVFRVLEGYASEATFLYVRQKRRARAKKRKDNGDSEPEDDNEGDSATEADKTTRERRFDFAKFENMFLNEGTLSAYERVLTLYQSAPAHILKHTLAWLHRVFVKREYQIPLFRLSLARLLLQVTSPREGLADPELRQSATRFMELYTRTLTNCLSRTPSLYYEFLFPKQRQYLHYFADPDAAEVDNHKRRTARLADVEIKDHSIPKERRVAICVAALLDLGHKDALDWAKNALENLAELANPEKRMRLMLNSSKEGLKFLAQTPILRLLLTETGLTVLGNRYILEPNADLSWFVEATLLVQRYCVEPVEFDQGDAVGQFKRTDGKQAETSANDERLDFVISESETESEDGFADSRLQPLSAEELLAKKLSQRGNAKPSKRASNATSGVKRKRSRNEKSAKERQLQELERRQRIRSSAFVDSREDESDEERDRAFFAQELAAARKRASESSTADLPDLAELFDSGNESGNESSNESDAENGANSRRQRLIDDSD